LVEKRSGSIWWGRVTGSLTRGSNTWSTGDKDGSGAATSL
jgi:hypothetical protein